MVGRRHRIESRGVPTIPCECLLTNRAVDVLGTQLQTPNNNGIASAFGTMPLSMPWIHRKVLELAKRATAHHSLLGAAHAVVVHGKYNVILTFTHAPSLFPSRSLDVPSRIVSLVTAGQTSRRQWLRKSKNTRKPNVVGKNNAPNPLKSKNTKTKSTGTLASTHEKKAGDIQGVIAVGCFLLFLNFPRLGKRSIPITFGCCGFLGCPQVLCLQKKVWISSDQPTRSKTRIGK